MNEEESHRTTLIDNYSSCDNDKSTVQTFQTDLRDSDLLVSEFSVKITNHKKVASFLETFLVYSIQTTGDFRPYVVDRRYNDFQWLYQRLVERYPMAIVPPLPGKHSLTSIERFSGAFIEQRLEALDKFLQRVTAHVILGLDKEFWSFLTLLPTMFQEFKKSRPFLGKVETLIQSIQSLSTAASGAITNGRVPDSGFYSVECDSARLGTIMTSLARVVRRTEEVWQNISTVIVDSAITANGWDALSAMGALTSQTAGTIRVQIEPWVVESGLYCAQVERVARRRNEAETRFLVSVAKQQQQSVTARQDVNELHDALSKNNADLSCELERWRTLRSAETVNWLKQLADLHVDHYRQASAMWRQMVAGVCD